MGNVNWVVMAAFVLFAGFTFLRMMSMWRAQLVQRARNERARDRDISG